MENHEEKQNPNVNHVLSLLSYDIKQFFYHMLKWIGPVPISILWINRIPGGLFEEINTVFSIIDLYKVFWNAIFDLQVWQPWEIGCTFLSYIKLTIFWISLLNFFFDLWKTGQKNVLIVFYILFF